MAGNNGEVYDKKPQRYTPKTTLRSGKSEAQVTIIIIKSARVIILLRLTADGHKASRGLSATADFFTLENKYTVARISCRRRAPSVHPSLW